MQDHEFSPTAGDGGGQAGSPAAAPPASAGAQPSITAPANCIRPLRQGVDGVYLSYPGGIDRDMAVILAELKQQAQSINEKDLAQAAFYNGDHFFTMSPRGRGRFAFVLEDNWFRVELSNASANVLPLAHVQVRSEYLMAHALSAFEINVRKIDPERVAREGS
jgi:hypothetical protein